MARVAVIVPNWNGLKFIERCLESLSAQTFTDFETVVVDNGSTDGSDELVERKFPGVRLLRLDGNYGFSVAVNRGVNSTVSEYVAFLNNDTEVDPAWLSELVRALDAEPEAGSAASKILWDNARKTIYAAGDFFCREGFGGNLWSGKTDGPAFAKPAPVFAASACACLYRRSTLDDIGLLDERFFIFYEDIDLAFRAQLAGWSCFYVPTSVVYHTGTGTVGIFSASRGYRLARNSLYVVAKDLPGKLIRCNLDHILQHLAQETVQALDRGRPWGLLRARAAAIAALPWLLNSRKSIQRARRSDLHDLNQLIPPYREICPEAGRERPKREAFEEHSAAERGERRALVIRSAGPLLPEAIRWVREKMKVSAIDVLVMAGFEDQVPAEEGANVISYPGRGRFCGILMPRLLARCLRARNYDFAVELCSGDPKVGFLNIDLVALRAKIWPVYYYMPGGKVENLSRALVLRKFVQWTLNAAVSLVSMAGAALFICAVMVASIGTDRDVRR